MVLAWPSAAWRIEMNPYLALLLVSVAAFAVPFVAAAIDDRFISRNR